MRSRRWVWVAAATLTAWGCGGGGGGDDSGGAVASGGSSSDGSAVTQQTYSNGHPIVVSTSDSYSLAQESEVVRIVNDHRVAIGKNALTSVASIANVARGHSDHMVVHAFFAHSNPEGDSPGTRLSKGGVSWSVAGENLAAGYATPESAFAAWMNSPGHKANIERTGWIYTGVGYWYDPGSTYKWYWTQNFTEP